MASKFEVEIDHGNNESNEAIRRGTGDGGFGATRGFSHTVGVT